MPREGGFVLISVFSTALKEQAQGLVGKSGSGETGLPSGVSGPGSGEAVRSLEL